MVWLKTVHNNDPVSQAFPNALRNAFSGTCSSPASRCVTVSYFSSYRFLSFPNLLIINENHLSRANYYLLTSSHISLTHYSLEKPLSSEGLSCFNINLDKHKILWFNMYESSFGPKLSGSPAVGPQGSRGRHKGARRSQGGRGGLDGVKGAHKGSPKVAGGEGFI